MPLKIVRGDITKMRCDAVVNAANSTLLGGGGVDGAIHRAAGRGLLKECRGLGGCEVGDAKVTGGYNLPCRFVIHTVGPVWRGGSHGEERLLRSCYRRSLELAKSRGCGSVAFPLISSGAFGYPKALALRTAADEISAFLSQNEMLVYIVVFDGSSCLISEKLYDDIAAYIDDKYADGHGDKERSRRLLTPRSAPPADSLDDAGFSGQGEGAFRSAQGRGDEEDKSGKLGKMTFVLEFPGESLPSDEGRDKGDKLDEMTFAFSSDEGNEPEDMATIGCFAPSPASGSAAALRGDTAELFALPTIPAAQSLDEALRHLDESFTEMLLRKIDEKGMTDTECYKKANIDRKLFSKIRGDKHYRPSKTTAIAFAVALELPLDEMKSLLMKAGFALSHSNKFDIIIEYFAVNGNYNIFEINEALFAFDQPLL